MQSLSILHSMDTGSAIRCLHSVTSGRRRSLQELHRRGCGRSEKGAKEGGVLFSAQARQVGGQGAVASAEAAGGALAVFRCVWLFLSLQCLVCLPACKQQSHTPGKKEAASVPEQQARSLAAARRTRLVRLQPSWRLSGLLSVLEHVSAAKPAESPKPVYKTCRQRSRICQAQGRSRLPSSRAQQTGHAYMRQQVGKPDKLFCVLFPRRRACGGQPVRAQAGTRGGHRHRRRQRQRPQWPHLGRGRGGARQVGCARRNLNPDS